MQVIIEYAQVTVDVSLQINVFATLVTLTFSVQPSYASDNHTPTLEYVLVMAAVLRPIFAPAPLDIWDNNAKFQRVSDYQVLMQTYAMEKEFALPTILVTALQIILLAFGMEIHNVLLALLTIQELTALYQYVTTQLLAVHMAFVIQTH